VVSPFVDGADAGTIGRCSAQKVDVSVARRDEENVRGTARLDAPILKGKTPNLRR